MDKLNLSWETFSDFVDKALAFIKELLSALNEWPLDLGIETK